MKNTFIALLDLLEVKHTKTFSEKCFNEHPHKNNLFGLSKLLSDYGVKNAGTRISDKKNDITEIQTPFIAQFSSEFVAVSNVEPDSVSFFWKGSDHVMPVAKFIEAWTGVVLLAESSEESIEPDYKKHKQTELINIFKKIIFFSAFGLLLVLAYFFQSLYTDVGISILLIVNLTGMYISWLLLLKQLHIESQYADKICSLFKQKDCNDILESEAAKMWGVIGWSEIGFGYFLANVLMLLFLPELITYIALINIITLPYSFWSVWYQKTKAKQWCMLCLIVQVLLWAIFIINLIGGYIRIPELGFLELFYLTIAGSCYFASILGINLLSPKLSADKSMQLIQQSLNSFKADEDIFKSALKNQPFYETNNCNSIIRFGNPESKLQITVLSNPYCNPCAKMHKRIEDFLLEINNNISIQYILSSFGENLNTTNKYLIAACMADKTGSAIQVLSNWFEKGKALRDDYLKDMELDIENPEVESEFQKHEAWSKETQLRSTPTILVNGYKLPENYKIEDLRYFTNLDI